MCRSQHKNWAWLEEAAQPGKDIGEPVRQRCKDHGLVMLPREELLPALPERLRPHVTPPPTPDADTPLSPWEVERNQERPLLRKLCAERRMQEALQALEDAELRQEPAQKLAWYETQYEQELTTYTTVTALLQACDSHTLPSDGEQ